MARLAPYAPALSVLVAAAGSVPVAAQDVEFERPPDWRVRLDDRAASSAHEVYFVDMPPGWHITTGPATILWHPETLAEGSYRAEMEVFLFDPGTRHEGFGIFVGGHDLDGAEPRYVYFLVREGGEFLVKERRGSTTRVLRDWTSHPSIVSYAGRPENSTTARNVLAVDAGDDDVRFLVNDREVLTLPRAELPSVEGVVGLRVNHALNLHVSRLEVRSGG